MRMQIERRNQGFSRIDVGGEIDFFSSPDLRKVISSLLNPCQKGILTDLSKVTYIDSSGIATLIEGVQKSSRLGITFRLTAISPAVKRAFEIVSLKEFFMRLTSGKGTRGDGAAMNHA